MNIYELYDCDLRIRKAFDLVCFDKMLCDGYCDMGLFIDRAVNKEQLQNALKNSNSKYLALLKNTYPKNIEEASNIWILLYGYNTNEHEAELSMDESIAVVYWFFSAYRLKLDKIVFAKNLFRFIKDYYIISNSIDIKGTVLYNKEIVDLKIIDSINDLNDLIMKFSNSGSKVFYRGHSNCNYFLEPSVFRNNKLKLNESQMYTDLLINCPDDFENCHTHLDKLVLMQHYGLPTRLIDITGNPLVALYFACLGSKDNYGEIILVSSDNVKTALSDTVTVLASLPLFSASQQSDIKTSAEQNLKNSVPFNKKVFRLLHEIRLEKPAFEPKIEPSDVINGFIVEAVKNNKRIINQDGAFILCGLVERKDLNRFKYRINGKKQIVLIKKNKSFTDYLNTCGINEARLFPEIDSVAKYIKDKYQE